MREARVRRLRRLAAASAALAVGVAVIGWAIVPFRTDSGAIRAGHAGGPTSSDGRTEFNPNQPARIDLRVALVCDYYEHGIEHAPPRQPGGSMQKREQYYTVPPDPFGPLRSKLANTPADAALRRELSACESDFLSDRMSAQISFAPLEAAAAQCSLDALTLLDVGRGMNYLAGDAPAASLYRAALEKASSQYKGVSPGDPAAQPLLHALDQLKALWRLKDYKAMETRFALAMALNPPLSPEGRRAGYLHAEMLFYNRHLREAADAILAVQVQHDKAGDLGALDASDVSEMDWVTGLFCDFDGRPEQALFHLERAASVPESIHVRHALERVIHLYAARGRTADARRQLKAYVLKYGRTDEAVEFATEILAREGRLPQADPVAARPAGNP